TMRSLTSTPFSTLILASHNQGKVKELQQQLAPLGVTLLSATDANLPDVIEDADTFAGNALKKAQAAAEKTGLPALADDSGLCVDALGGAPGVLTARYGDYHKLLKEMTGIENRHAYFVCVLALVIPQQKEPVFFEGK